MALAICVLGGCIRHMDPQLMSAYDQTTLGTSDSTAVLSTLQTPESEDRGDLLSQSDNVIASWGHKDELKLWPGRDKENIKMWLTMVAFNEDSTFVERKYYLYVDEHARWGWVTHPKWATIVYAQAQADAAVLEKPYANENARMSALLDYLREKFTSDTLKVSPDNKMIDVSNDVIDEAILTVQLILKESPARAVELSRPDGLVFQHKSFYKGRMRLAENDGMIKLEIKTGTYSEKSQDARTQTIGND